MPLRICFTQAPVSATGSCIRLRNSILIALSLARMRFLIVLRPMTNEPYLCDRVQKWGPETRHVLANCNRPFFFFLQDCFARCQQALSVRFSNWDGSLIVAPSLLTGGLLSFSKLCRKF